MAIATQFLILKATKVGESSLVLHTISREWGRKGFITSVSRRSPMAMFLPMSIIDAEVTENRKSGLWRLGKAKAVHQFNGIRSDFTKNAISLFISEVLYRTIRDGAYEEGLFEWMERTLLTLDALETNFCNFHLRFLLEFAGILGFGPSTISLMPFAGGRLQDITVLLESDFAGAMVLPLSGERRTEIAGILVKYIGFHTDTALDIRSLAVLHELFAQT